jgi:DNA-directed RNA polymerase specialized sigma24 family protein
MYQSASKEDINAVNQMIKNPERGFKLFYDLHHQDLLKYTVSKFHVNHFDGEEIVAEAMIKYLKYFRHLSSNKAEGELKYGVSLARLMVRNKASEFFRYHGFGAITSKAKPSSEFEPHFLDNAIQENGKNRTKESHISDIVLAAQGKLATQCLHGNHESLQVTPLAPKKEKTMWKVFVMLYEGYSMSEIASHLGNTIENVKYLRKKVIKQLAKHAVAL